jgi:hypothetical protein
LGFFFFLPGLVSQKNKPMKKMKHLFICLVLVLVCKVNYGQNPTCDVGYYYNFDPDQDNPIGNFDPIGTPGAVNGFCNGTGLNGSVCSITVCSQGNFVLVPGQYNATYGNWQYTGSSSPNITAYSVTPSTNTAGGYTIAYNSNVYTTNLASAPNNTFVGASLNLTNLPPGITFTIVPIDISGPSDCFSLIVTVSPSIPAFITPTLSLFCTSGSQCITYTPNNPANPPIYLNYNSGNGTTGNGQINANFQQTYASWCANYSTPGTYIGSVTASYNAYPQSSQAKCPTTHTFQVTVSSPIGSPTANASANTICSGETVTLTAGAANASSYTWQPGNIVGNPVTVNPTSNIVYTVTAGNAACPSKTTTVGVNVGECCLVGYPRNPVYNLGVVNIVAPGGSSNVWGSLTPGVTYNGNIALPYAGYIIQGNYNLAGNMNILTPTTFSRTNMAISENVTIFQNAPTTIANSWWHACSQMWNSIRSSTLLTVTGSIIEDANVAITPAGSTHPGMSIENNVFNLNYTSISFLGTTISEPGGSPAFACKGNIFTCKTLTSTDYSNAFNSANIFVNTLAPNLNSYAVAFIKGSAVQSVPSGNRSSAGIRLMVMGNTFNVRVGEAVAIASQNSLKTNYFDFLDYGVYNIASKVSVLNAVCQNISGWVGSLPAAGVYHNGGITKVGSQTTSGISSTNFAVNFANSNNAIYATVGGTVEADCNNMSGLVRAVSVVSITGTQSKVSITTNTFVNCQIDLYAYTNSPNLTCYFEQNAANGPYTAGKRHHVFINEVNKANSAVYKIKNNNLTGKDIGVSLQNAKNSTVFNNIINIDFPTILAGITYNGIELINVDNSYITDNIINCYNGTAILNTSVMGISSATCANNTYACNSIRNTGVCFKYQGNCPSNIWKNRLNINRGVGCKYGIWLDNSGATGTIAYPGSAPGLNEFGDFDYTNNGADTYVSGGAGSIIGYNGEANSTNIYFPLVNNAALGLTPYTTAYYTGTNLYDCGFSNRQGISGQEALTDEDIAASGIQIYPNPAQNDLFIKMEAEDCNLIITDISGRTVLTKPLTATNKLDLSALNNGIYFFRIMNADQTVIKTEKIIVHH